MSIECFLADAAIEALAACHELRHANLTWCVQLSDAALIALAMGCPKLELLSVHGLQRITDASIEALADECSACLHTLDINGCLGIKHYDRDALKTAFPLLQCFLYHK